MNHWSRKLWSILFIVFCLEIGLFLLIYPWTDMWGDNMFLSMAPRWNTLWFSGYFRGLLSGLGALNVYIAVVEIIRLRRFAPAPTHSHTV